VPGTIVSRVADEHENELVRRWFHATADLHRRGVKLWHAGDFAEILVAAAIGGTRARSNVQRGYDIEGPDGTRWQVKAMVNRPGNVRTSVGWLRPEAFDVLAIVYFGEDMRSVQAWTAPADIVAGYSQRHDPERGAHRLTLTKRLLRDPRVRELPLELPAELTDADL
jgi:hypothetical protein